MAITQNTKNEMWECLSTDTKPTSGVTNGQKILIIDTSEIYAFDGEGDTWYEYKQIVETTVAVGAVEIKDADTGDTAKIDTAGRLLVEAEQDSHDNFNANANLQIGDVDVSISNRVPVNTIGISNTTLIEGNLDLSGSAQQLDADTSSKIITLQANPDNAGYVYVGRSSSVTTTVHMAVLSAGSSMTFSVSNANLLYVIGTASDKVSFGGEV